jgi:hypothetical protein
MAMTMRNIDRIADGLRDAFAGSRVFAGVESVIDGYADAAKRKCETLRTDPDIFEIWPAFVVAGEQLVDFEPRLPASHDRLELTEALEGSRLLRQGRQLVSNVTRARTPMPKSTDEFLAQCENHRKSFGPPPIGSGD